MDDEWLVEKCLQGKTAYWNILIHRYQDRLFERVSKEVEKPEDAWNVVEDTFLQAKTTLSSFRDFRAASLESYERACLISRRRGDPEMAPLFFMWLYQFAAKLSLREVRGE